MRFGIRVIIPGEYLAREGAELELALSLWRGRYKEQCNRYDVPNRDETVFQAEGSADAIREFIHIVELTES